MHAVEVEPSDDEGAPDCGPARCCPSKKRKGKSTRWNIPAQALQILEQVFQKDKFPTVETRKKLSSDLNVTPRQVQVWFQNKRQRSVKPPAKGDGEQPHEILSTSVRCRLSRIWAAQRRQSIAPLCLAPLRYTK